MRVIGTAGHVDHGKSTLVKALTGIDPDRLAEEQARQMTIDLGFAWITLPNGETLGIVDVPGHRDFIENMLAGVGGIDAVLLVIAADEGVMPQTREHLAILDLLSIQNGLIVLTKTDLVDDPGWLELVQQDILEITEGTTLDGADIVPVSAHTGLGLKDLLDRSLLGGKLHVGYEIELQPSGLRGRIRGLQSYKKSVEVVQPGGRVAVNISGIDKKLIERGNVLAYPGQLQPTMLADVRFRHLKDTVRTLNHNAEVKLFSGASEALAHVRLIGDETLAPGEEGWLQVRLEEPLTLSHGDRFILRYPSPGETIGGGVIVNPHPGRRWRRFQPSVIQHLETQMLGTPVQRVAQAAQGPEPVKRQQLQKLVGYADADLNQAIEDALNEGLLRALPDGTLLSAGVWQNLLGQIARELLAFHQSEPLRSGMSREELRSRLGMKQSTLTTLLEANPDILSEGTLVRLVSHKIQFTPAQVVNIEKLMRLMQDAPFAPPSYSEAVQIVGDSVVRALIDLGELVQVQPDVIFARPAYDVLVTSALQRIDETGDVTAASLRDTFQTSRKYAIGLLEHLDSIGVTRRVGDSRVRGSRR
jgi:selenocysteine-specific elongation factor